MEPYFLNNDKNMFYKYLNNATIYIEFGCGGSTYQASIRDNITHIYSIESDKEWINKLNKIFSSNKINFIYNEMDTKPNTWGLPGINSTDIQKINYSSQLYNLNKNIIDNINLILIDGRFRVACCLKSFLVINNNCLILFDDFLNRPVYHIVLEFFDIIDKTIDNSMVVLKKKLIVNINKLHNLIKQYELNTD